MVKIRYANSAAVRFVLRAACLALLYSTRATDSHIQEEASPSGRVALVTLLTTHAYVAGALVLGASLDSVNATGDRVALVIKDDPRSDITSQDLDDLRELGWNLHLVNASSVVDCRLSDDIRQVMQAQAPGMLRYWGTCHKFACWSLVQYDTVLYIDADSIALNNPDHLMEYAKSPGFQLAAVPEPCAPQQNTPCGTGFQSALLLIKPSMAVFEFLKKYATMSYAPEGELPLLNQVFRDTWVRLPKHTMVASTHGDRPRVPSTDTDGKPSLMVDWTQVVTYDFAGPPDFKPWHTYALQKSTGNRYLINKLGAVGPDSPTFHNLMHPQWHWNDLYDDVLLQLGRGKETEQEL